MLRKKRLVYALGAGAAYGYAHIGVLKALEEKGIYPSAIVGTSMGAIIGALYAYGYKSKELEQIACNVGNKQVARLFFPSFPKGGIINSSGVKDFMKKIIGDIRIEDLKIPFRSVATDIKTGEQIVFDKGPLIDAIIASMSIQGVFAPYRIFDRYLVDGSLCNPLPWDIAYTIGDNVIAVNVYPHSRIKNKTDTFYASALKQAITESNDQKNVSNKLHEGNIIEAISDVLKEMKNSKTFNLENFFSEIIDISHNEKKKHNDAPSLIGVLMAWNTLTVDPFLKPEKKWGKGLLLIEPELDDFGPFDFTKGKEIIARGYEEIQKHDHTLYRIGQKGRALVI